MPQINKKQPGSPPPENKMGVLPEGKLLFSMALPMMLSMLVQALYNIVDSMFVAQISENAFNAVGLAFPLQNLMISVASGTGVGMNAFLSRSLGERKQETANRTAHTGLVLAMCSWLVFALLDRFFSRSFFMAQAAAVPEIVEFGIQYAHICVGLSLGLFSQFCVERLLQATGRTTLSMVTQLIGALLNIILDPILIFGLFGLPAMGVPGAAWATVIGQFVSAFAGLLLNLWKNPDIQLSFSGLRWDPEIIKEIYRVGVPSILMQSIGSVMTFGMNRILFVFTPTATAVFGAYFKVQSFVFMPVFGLNNGMVPIISYNYGARRMDRVKRTIQLTMLTSLSVMVVGTIVFQMAPDTLLRIFDASPDMIALGIPAFRIISTSFLLAGFSVIAVSVSQAIGNPIHCVISSVVRQLVVLLPAAWLLAQTGKLALVWFAFPIAELACTILSAWYLHTDLRAARAHCGELPEGK